MLMLLVLLRQVRLEWKLLMIGIPVQKTQKIMFISSSEMLGLILVVKKVKVIKLKY